MLDESSVDSLKKKLYRRGEKPHLKPRRELHEIEFEETHTDWKENEEHKEELVKKTEEEEKKEELQNLYAGKLPSDYTDEPEILNDKRFKRGLQESREKKKIAFRVIKLVFFVSLIFFLFALAFAGYFLLGDVNQISCKNVKIVTAAPRSIASGKKLMMDVIVENTNPVQMQNVELEIVFPEGTKDADYSNVSMPSTKQEIGVVNVNEQVRSPVRALLFGQEMSQHTIRSIVTFTVEGSDAEISCESSYNIAIATAPINLTVRGLEEISSGQEVELEIVISSNSEERVTDLRLIVDYPFGFEFVSSEPKPINDENSVWEIGNVDPGIERMLKLKGIVRGQGTDLRNISISVGEKDVVNKDALAIVLHKVEHTLVVTEPFLALDLELNGNNDARVGAKLGDPITGFLVWENTTDNALHDVQIEAKFNGAMLDPLSVASSNGFFRSIDNTLIWTPQTTKDELRLVQPGEKKSYQFRFNTYTYNQNTSGSNFTMDIDFDVQARRISDNILVPQTLTGQAKKTMVFDSELKLDAYALYSVGPFINTGPNPPRVNRKSTYTVVWDVTNSMNDAHAVFVKGTLPIYAEWLGAIDPSSETVVYNSVTREITWQIGNLQRGTGFQTASKKVQFQIAILPSISQLGKRIYLMTDVKIQGIDNFTERVLEQEVLKVDTKLTKDPTFMGGNGFVEP